jgi:hypothetical protein
MDTVHLIVIAASLGIIAGGARMIYCGHRHRPERRHSHVDRRRQDRHSDRREP